jgi:hypothetical protein
MQYLNRGCSSSFAEHRRPPGIFNMLMAPLVHCWYFMVPTKPNNTFHVLFNLIPVPALFGVPISYREAWSSLLDSLPWGGWHWHYIATDETRHIVVLGPVGMTVLCVSCHLSSPPLFLSSLPCATCTAHHSSAFLCTPNYTPFQSLLYTPAPSTSPWLAFSTRPITSHTLPIYSHSFIHSSTSINQTIHLSIHPSTHPPTQFWHCWTSWPLKMKALDFFETSGTTYPRRTLHCFETSGLPLFNQLKYKMVDLTRCISRHKLDF